MAHLSEIQKRQLFKALATKSQVAAGKEFGLDKEYEGNVRIINAVRGIYNEVSANPEKFGVSTEIVEMVNKGMQERKKNKNSPSLTSEPFSTTVGQDMEKAMVSRVKGKLWNLIERKVDYLGTHSGAFHKESLMSLMKAGGIAFDKAQIDAGQATEHIALIAKVHPDMSSADALVQLLKIKESRQNDD